MSLEDDIKKAFGFKEKSSKTVERAPKTRKLIVPEYVITAWEQISKSIESIFGKIQKDGKRKWDSKYAHYINFKEWFEKVI